MATPSVDARLMNRLGLPPRVKRMPIFGLGCVAGAARGQYAHAGDEGGVVELLHVVEHRHPGVGRRALVLVRVKGLLGQGGEEFDEALHVRGENLLPVPPLSVPSRDRGPAWSRRCTSGRRRSRLRALPSTRARCFPNGTAIFSSDR